MMDRLFLLCMLSILSISSVFSSPTIIQYTFDVTGNSNGVSTTLGSTLSSNPNNSSQRATSATTISLGGLSGLRFLSLDGNGNSLYIASVDRGPVAGLSSLIPNSLYPQRPFLLQDFSPIIVSFSLSPVTHEITVNSYITLARSNGGKLTGLPNLQTSTIGLPYTDELGVDIFGNTLVNDPLGADLEGIEYDNRDGTYWLCDDYRPSIYHFDSNGLLIDRFIPLGAPTNSGEYGTPVLPAYYSQRQPNRGFSGIALENDILYLFMQSPIYNPDTQPNNTVPSNSANIRILAFDTTSNQPVAEYVYVLSDGHLLTGRAKVDKIGDAVSLGNGKFYVIERDSQVNVVDSNKFVFEVDIQSATNILNASDLIPPGETLETIDISTTSIVPVNKTLVLNLATLGYTAEQVDGITFIDEQTFAVVNDNNYGISTSPLPGNGKVFQTPTPTVLAVIGNLGTPSFNISATTTTTTTSTTTTTTSTITTTSTTTSNATTQSKRLTTFILLLLSFLGCVILM